MICWLLELRLPSDISSSGVEMAGGAYVALVKMLNGAGDVVWWLSEKRLTDLELPKMLILGCSCRWSKMLGRGEVAVTTGMFRRTYSSCFLGESDWGGLDGAGVGSCSVRSDYLKRALARRASSCMGSWLRWHFVQVTWGRATPRRSCYCNQLL